MGVGGESRGGGGGGRGGGGGGRGRGGGGGEGGEREGGGGWGGGGREGVFLRSFEGLSTGVLTLWRWGKSISTGEDRRVGVGFTMTETTLELRMVLLLRRQRRGVQRDQTEARNQIRYNLDLIHSYSILAPP